MPFAVRAGVLFGLFAISLLAQEADRSRADSLMVSAAALSAEKSPEALHRASASFLEAADLWRKINEPAKQFEALNSAAWTHFPLQEFAEMSRLLEQAEAVGGPNGPAFRANVLTGFSVIHNAQGEFSKAIAELREAREIFRKLGDKATELQVTGFQANAYRMQGLAQEKDKATLAAIASHERAAALFQEAGDAGRAGNSVLKLGQLSEQPFTPLGWEQAAAYYTRAIALLQTAADRSGEATAWFRLADVTDSLGQIGRSRDAYLKVVPFLAELKNPRIEGLTYKGLADAEVKLNHLLQAVDYYKRALPPLASAHDSLSQYLAGMKLAKAYETLERYPDALQTYREVVTFTHDNGASKDEAVALSAVGRLQLRERQWQAALAAFTAEQTLYATLGEKELESLSWSSIASVHESRGEYQQKLDADLRALALLENARNGTRRSAALRAVGDSYNSLNNPPKALDFLNHALALSDRDPAFRAGVLVEIGEVYYGQTRLDEALKFQNQALEIALPLGPPPFLNRIRTDIGLTLQAQGEPSKAKAIFEQALASARERSDIQQQCTGLHNLARLLQDSGKSQEAEKLYLESLRLAHADGEREQEAISLRSLGMVYHSQAREEEALRTLNRALALDRDLENPNGESADWNNIGLVYADTGQSQQGLDAFSQALSLMRALGDNNEVASELRNLGTIYQGLGDYDGAVSYFNEALETHRAFQDEHGEALTHNSLGVLKLNAGKPDAALLEFALVLPVVRKYGDRASEAIVLSNIANACIGAGNFAEAIRDEEESLRAAREIHDLNGEALALHGLGSAWESSGGFRRALDSALAARALWRQLHNINAEAKADSLIAKIERKQGNAEAALTDARAAIRVLEAQRSALASEDQRAYYLASVGSPWTITIGLLMDKHRRAPSMGFDRQAFETSESERARSLVDLLAGSRAGIRQGADRGLLNEQLGVQRTLSAKAGQLRVLPREGADFRKLQVEIQDLTSQSERLESRIRAANPRYAARAAAQSLTLQQIQNRVLDSDTALLEYSLGEDRSFLFLVTRTSFETFELPSQSEIDSAVNNFFDEVTSRRVGRTAFPAAVALSHMLLGSAAAHLTGRRLVIVADGTLSGIPFAALPEPSSGKPLIVSNEIVTEPSVSAIAILRHETAGRKPAPREIVVIADPVFERDDERFGGVAVAASADLPRGLLRAAAGSATRDADRIERLPHTREEADGIAALTAPTKPLELLDFNANKSAVLAGNLSPFRIVHFATHGFVDDARPQLSGLVLSTYDVRGQPQDGFLRLTDIFGMKLSADLVVLSACESGRGKLVGGEGMMGTTRGFLYAGARSLVVSLWNVNDAATAKLMGRFYQELLAGPHQRPAAALRSAQIWMLSSSEWHDPYYWAPFTFQGEWR
ncbi:MAG: CHAT domain-containing protein [Acidobacteriota bacterium]|nr:CHAT domain-containing protein [Acidobacteriota bacterium]